MNDNHNSNKQQQPITDLDNLFRQANSRLDKKPSEAAWQKVEHKLRRQPPRPTPLFVKPQIWAIAAVLLLVLLPVAFFVFTDGLWKSDKSAQIAEQTASTTPQLDSMVAYQIPATAAVEEPSPIASTMPSKKATDVQKTGNSHKTSISNTAPRSQKPTTAPPPPAANPKYPSIDLKNQNNALDFIHTLQQYKNAYCVYVNTVSAKWINNNDVEQLMAMLDNTQPIPAVVSAESHYRPTAPLRSTVGNEAFLLLKAYKKQQESGTADYPPYPKSVQIISEKTNIVVAQSKAEPSAPKTPSAPTPRSKIETNKDRQTNATPQTQTNTTMTNQTQLYVNSNEINLLRQWWQDFNKRKSD